MYNNATITSVLQYSDISLYLGAQDYEAERYYNWKDERERLEIIYAVSDVVSYFQPYYNSLNIAIQNYIPSYTGNASYDQLVSYLYTSIGRWVYDAAIIAGNGTGIVVGQGTSQIITQVVYALNLSYKSYTATGGETTISYPDMAGKACVFVSRGGVVVNNIITSGTPAADEVLWNGSSLTFSSALSAGVVVVSLFN